MTRATWRTMVGGITLMLVLTACGGSSGDRAVAVDNLMELFDLTEDQANCVVDEFGEDRLGDVDNFDPEAGGTDEEAAAAGQALVTCALGDLGGLDDGDLGDGGFGVSDPEDIDSIDCSTVDGPCEYGDDAELDALWDACEDGDGQACDDLYFQSPFGSKYEAFGNTCGGRGFESRCAEVYGD